MALNEVVLCGAVRTSIGTYGGALKEVPASELGAAVIRETLLRNGLAGSQVQSLVMGNVIQAGNRMNPARQAGLAAGLPVEVPALTVNRVCGSGAQAVVSAALEVAAGMVDCVVAGGMENMDRAPYLLPQGRWGRIPSCDSESLRAVWQGTDCLDGANSVDGMKQVAHRMASRTVNHA